MKLVELEPRFIRHIDGGSINVGAISEADGIIFLCPKCFRKNGGKVGTHSIICWNPSVPIDVKPGPGRWNLEGTGYDDLSLVAGSSSIAISGGCTWHGFVTSGEVTDA